MFRAARADSNQREIVEAFRKLGCSVKVVSQLKGFADLLVARNFRTMVVEVKDGSKPPSARKLTKDEQEFRESWKGIYVVVESVDDAIQAVRLLG